MHSCLQSIRAERTVYLEGGAVGRIHNDKQRLPGEGEQVSWVKAAEEATNNIRATHHDDTPG